MAMMSSVTPIEGYRRARIPGRDQQLKRLAIQIAAQLPDDTEEAIDVLEHVRTLVRGFLNEPRPV